ncbi:DeoR/GlpR family DNA-binding transcription regulator [Bacillus sp. D386]|uniref:DeoR/GlpR family DNA-binding transcription regulator n=1 Tax=Bacillus sp. D386 TaxID=2587155 RepID=UPI001122248F|nr:DeoR/GlpR family DNA-binding transcription regulator [Bacillus sp. D386]
MKAFERREKITNMLHREKKVLVAQLAVIFSVTEETIRRDLEKLEKDGILTRNHGGAVINIQNEDLPYRMRHTRKLEEKKAIAQTLLPLIQESSTIMADSSSTVYESLHILMIERNNLTVISNSVNILQSIKHENHTVISTGGTLKDQTNSLSGVIARSSLLQYNVDIALISCKGVSMQNGITDSNEQEAELKKVMSKQANKTILLVDSSKFDHTGFIKMFNFHQIDYLITDKKPDNDWIVFLENQNIIVLYPDKS